MVFNLELKMYVSFLFFFLCVCVCIVCVCARVCVTQPHPGISDGNTVRLQWTNSKDVKPKQSTHTLTLSHVHSHRLSLKQIHTKSEHTHTHTHTVKRNNHTERFRESRCMHALGRWVAFMLAPCHLVLCKSSPSSQFRVQKFKSSQKE